jgi:hypothetical protein
MTFSDDIARHKDPTREAQQPSAGRRCATDEGSVEDALEAVRALDADAYQELLEALGLTPDPRLSIPGCGSRRR